MTKERRIGLGILAGFLVVGLITAAIVLAHESKTLTYTLVFDDAQGIQRGARVQLNGVDIGVVKFVQLYPQPPRVEINVKIPPEHAEKVRADSTAMIRDVAFPNVSGQKIIEILNPEEPATVAPMPKESVIYGLDGFFELQAWKLKGALVGSRDAWSDRLDRLGDSLKNLNREIKEMAASPQVREALAELQDFMVEMKDKGRQAAVQLHEQWPRVRDQLEPVLKELTEYGREYIVKQIRQIMQQIEATLQEWREVPAPTPAVGPIDPIAQNNTQT